MTAHDLARAAQTVRKSTRRYTPMEPYIPAVDVLRRKGWSWEAIHTWLRSQGQRVQESHTTFAACMGRCYRRWISREAARRAPKADDFSLPAESPPEISLDDVPLTDPPAKRPVARRHRLPRRKKGGNVNTTSAGTVAATTSPAAPTEPPPTEAQS